MLPGLDPLVANAILRSPDKPALRIVMISTYPPTQCGIATYGAHSRSAIQSASLEVSGHALVIDVIEMVPEKARHSDPGIMSDPVVFQIGRNNPQDYKNAAAFINENKYDIVMVEHEFGIYGGLFGIFLVDLLSLLHSSVKVQLNVHTTDLNAPPMMNFVFQLLLGYTNQVIGLSEAQCNVMRFQHPVLEQACEVIPHGVAASAKLDDSLSPEGLIVAKRKAKTLLGYDPDSILMISGGLLAPSKNLVMALEVVDIVTRRYPNLVYVIAGTTHPTYLKEHGSYVVGLKKKAEELGIENNVDFVEKYLADEAMMQYYNAADIFLSVYPGMQQTSSGMIPFAMSCGCAIVTTPFLHASSLLSNSGGLVAPLDSGILAMDVLNLLFDKTFRLQLAMKAIDVAKDFHWERVGMLYLQSYRRIQTMEKVLGTFEKKTATYSGYNSHVISGHGYFVSASASESPVRLGILETDQDFGDGYQNAGNFLEYSVTYKGRTEHFYHRLGTSTTRVGTTQEGYLQLTESIKYCDGDSGGSCNTVIEVSSTWEILTLGIVCVTKVSVFRAADYDNQESPVRLHRFIFGLDQLSNPPHDDLIIEPNIATGPSTVGAVNIGLSGPSRSKTRPSHVRWTGDPRHLFTFSKDYLDGHLHYATMSYDISRPDNMLVVGGGDKQLSIAFHHKFVVRPNHLSTS